MEYPEFLPPSPPSTFVSPTVASHSLTMPSSVSLMDSLPTQDATSLSVTGLVQPHELSNPPYPSSSPSSSSSSSSRPHSPTLSQLSSSASLVSPASMKTSIASILASSLPLTHSENNGVSSSESPSLPEILPTETVDIPFTTSTIAAAAAAATTATSSASTSTILASPASPKSSLSSPLQESLVSTSKPSPEIETFPLPSSIPNLTPLSKEPPFDPDSLSSSVLSQALLSNENIPPGSQLLPSTAPLSPISSSSTPMLVTPPNIFSATYSSISVWEIRVNGIDVMRRCRDNWLNATQLLKVAKIDKPQRTKILEREIQTGEHEKVQGGYGKYQGTWVPFERGAQIAHQFNVFDVVCVLLEFNPEEHPNMPVAPKKSMQYVTQHIYKIRAKNSSDPTNFASATFSSLEKSPISHSDNLLPPPSTISPKGKRRREQFLTEGEEEPPPRQVGRRPRKTNSTTSLVPSPLSRPSSAHSLPDLHLSPSITYSQDDKERRDNLDQTPTTLSGLLAVSPSPIPSLTSSPPVARSKPLGRPKKRIAAGINGPLEKQRQLTNSKSTLPAVSSSIGSKSNSTTSSSVVRGVSGTSSSTRPHGRRRGKASSSISMGSSITSNHHPSTSSINSVNVNKKNSTFHSVSPASSYVSSPSSSSSSSSSSSNSTSPLPSTSSSMSVSTYHPPSLMPHSKASVSSSSSSLYLNEGHHVTAAPNTTSTVRTLKWREIMNHDLRAFTRIPPLLLKPPPDFPLHLSLDDQGHTILHWASALGRIDCVQLLLSQGHPPHFQALDGTTPLMWATLFDDNYRRRTFPELLDRIPVQFVDQHGRTLFHFMAMVGGLEERLPATLYYLKHALRRVDVDFVRLKDIDGHSAFSLSLDYPAILELLEPYEHGSFHDSSSMAPNISASHSIELMNDHASLHSSYPASSSSSSMHQRMAVDDNDLYYHPHTHPYSSDSHYPSYAPHETSGIPASYLPPHHSKYSLGEIVEEEEVADEGDDEEVVEGGRRGREEDEEDEDIEEDEERGERRRRMERNIQERGSHYFGDPQRQSFFNSKSYYPPNASNSRLHRYSPSSYYTTLPPPPPPSTSTPSSMHTIPPPLPPPPPILTSRGSFSHSHAHPHPHAHSHSHLFPSSYLSPSLSNHPVLSSSSSTLPSTPMDTYDYGEQVSMTLENESNRSFGIQTVPATDLDKLLQNAFLRGKVHEVLHLLESLQNVVLGSLDLHTLFHQLVQTTKLKLLAYVTDLTSEPKESERHPQLQKYRFLIAKCCRVPEVLVDVVLDDLVAAVEEEEEKEKQKQKQKQKHKEDPHKKKMQVSNDFTTMMGGAGQPLSVPPSTSSSSTTTAPLDSQDAHQLAQSFLNMFDNLNPSSSSTTTTTATISTTPTVASSSCSSLNSSASLSDSSISLTNVLPIESSSSISNSASPPPPSTTTTSSSTFEETSTPTLPVSMVCSPTSSSLSMFPNGVSISTHPKFISSSTPVTSSIPPYSGTLPFPNESPRSFSSIHEEDGECEEGEIRKMQYVSSEVNL